MDNTKSKNPFGRPRQVPVTLSAHIVVEQKEVADPYDGTRLKVDVNTNESIVERWHVRGDIDGAQYSAAERLRFLWEKINIVGAKAFDYAQPKVDGGAIYDPAINFGLVFDPHVNRKVDPGKVLGGAKNELGREHYKRIASVVGERRQLEDVAAEYGFRNERQVKLFSAMIRDHLKTLAEHWKMLAKGSNYRF